MIPRVNDKPGEYGKDFVKIRFESDGINKSNTSKECMLCNYWYFKDIGYKFQPYACNRCHNLSMMVYDLDDFMILDIKGVDYRCFVCNLSKNTAIKLLNNSQVDDKGTLSIWILVQIKHLLK